MGLSDAISFATQAWEHDQQGKTPPRYINKFGYNLAISTSEETVFGAGGVRTWESAAFSAEITSSNNNDKQDYQVQGLDANFDWQTVTITANGTADVPIPTVTWRDVFRIINLDSLTDQNAGSVDVFKAGDSANPKCRVLAGANQSTCGAMTVPRRYNAYLRRLSFSSSTDDMQGRLYVNEQLKRQATVANTPFESIYDIMPVFGPQSRIELRGELVSGGSPGTLEGNFDIVLMRT